MCANIFGYTLRDLIMFSYLTKQYIYKQVHEFEETLTVAIRVRAT